MTGEQGVRLDRRLAWLILVTFALGLVAAQSAEAMAQAVAEVARMR